MAGMGISAYGCVYTYVEGSEEVLLTVTVLSSIVLLSITANSYLCSRSLDDLLDIRAKQLMTAVFFTSASRTLRQMDPGPWVCCFISDLWFSTIILYDPEAPKQGIYGNYQSMMPTIISSTAIEESTGRHVHPIERYEVPIIPL